jgi:hypothetical protein
VTGAISSTGALTVGVDDTGHDVKFFGAAAGAYMLYDQSEDQLEIRGASADATTSTGKLLLSTSLTNVNANDVIGSINFQAPAEAGGTDAITIAAGIRAVAQATFTCAVNATDLIFYTGHSEAATEKFRFTSQGEIGIGGANYGNDGQVLTSTGGGTAVAWECVSGGISGLGSTDNAILRANGTGGATAQGSSAIITDAGLIQVANGCATTPGLSFKCSTGIGLFHVASNKLAVGIGGSERARFSCAKFHIADCADGDLTRGITINQDDADNSILSLKSTDVTHGVTTLAETDTYMKFKKRSTKAGSEITSIGDCGSEAFTLVAIAAADDTSHTAGGNAPIQFRSGIACGTGVKGHAANGNLFVVRTNTGGNTRFIVDTEGDLFADGGSESSTMVTLYDDYCDAQLVRTFTQVFGSSGGSGLIDNHWDDFIKYNEQTLIDLRLIGGPRVGVDPHEVGLINYTGMVRLHSGAIWQLHSKLNDQSEELAALKGQLNALTEGK